MTEETLTRAWLERVIPLPKEARVLGVRRVRAGEIGLICDLDPLPPIKTAVALLRGWALGSSKGAKLTLRLALAGDPAIGALPVAQRLATRPNAAEAYAIVAQGEGANETLLILANTPQGLLQGARTLAQLARRPEQVTAMSEIELPWLDLEDWPDLPERGQWGGNVEQDLPWTSQWKLNVVEVGARPNVDAHGQPVIGMDRDLFRQGAELGVKIVPFLLHLEQITRYAGLMNRREFWSTPDPSKPLPSDYTPGLCMSSPAVHAILEGWLRKIMEIEAVTDIMVWLSEDRAPCYCEKCVGKEPFELEVQTIVQAFNRAKAAMGRPGLRLRILTTQGSYPVNDKVMAAAPPDVGITYYDGGRTYDSSRKPMIYPLLEDYARSGRWLGCYPQITHCWRTVFPWTAPQFIQYRAQEFVDKKLSCIIGYAVPSNRYHEFNVMALGEWAWNAHGRSAEEFARAYALKRGLPDPDLFARWALKAGEAGWTLAESRLFLTLIYNPTLRIHESGLDDHRFEMAGIVEDLHVDEALRAAQEALELARQASDPAMLDESESVLAGLDALRLLGQVLGPLRSGQVEPAQRQAMADALGRLDRCAHILRNRLLAWGQRIAGEEKLPTRLLDTAFVLLRTADALWARAGELGIADPWPEARLLRLGEWSAADFRQGQHTTLTFNLTGLVPAEGGSYQVGFDFIPSAYGTDITQIAVVELDAAQGASRVVAETPDQLKRVSIWERWCEMRLEIPPRPAGKTFLLQIGLAGFPPDAPEERRSSSGAVSLRRVWPQGRAPWER